MTALSKFSSTNNQSPLGVWIFTSFIHEIVANACTASYSTNALEKSVRPWERAHKVHGLSAGHHATFICAWKNCNLSVT